MSFGVFKIGGKRPIAVYEGESAEGESGYVTIRSEFQEVVAIIHLAPGQCVLAMSEEPAQKVPSLPKKSG
jgi:hypothetical protein